MKPRCCQEIKKWQCWKPRRQSSEPSTAGAALPSPPLPLLPVLWQNLGDALGQPSATNVCEKEQELGHCLTEQPASSFYTWLSRKMNEMKRRSIAFCFEVLNLSFLMSPAGTKLMEWRHSAWFSWYPTAVAVLLPELLTHAAMQQESYFSMKSSEERFIALQKSSTEPFNVFAKCSPASQCCGCFTWGRSVAQSTDRGSTLTPSPQ